MNMTSPDPAKDAERVAYATASLATDAAAVANAAAYDRAADTIALAAEAAQSNLAAHAAAGEQIRHQADRTQLRLALRNLTEGVRGMIRVSPLSSVFLGIVIGIAVGKRRIHHSKKARRA